MNINPPAAGPGLVSSGTGALTSILDFSSYSCTVNDLKFSNLTLSCAGAPVFTATGTNLGITLTANGTGAVVFGNGQTASVVIDPASTVAVVRGSSATTSLQFSGNGASAPVVMASGLMLGTNSGLALGVVAAELGFQRIAATGTAAGAGGGKLELVCGTNSGTAKLIAYAGTSTTPVTLLDNIGAGNTGC
jgi:hypothetical protein